MRVCILQSKICGLIVYISRFFIFICFTIVDNLPRRIGIVYRIIAYITIRIPLLGISEVLIYSFGSRYFPEYWIFCGEPSDPIVIISFFKVLQVSFIVLLFVCEEVFVFVSSLLSLDSLVGYLVSDRFSEWLIICGLEERTCDGEVDTTRAKMI